MNKEYQTATEAYLKVRSETCLSSRSGGRRIITIEREHRLTHFPGVKRRAHHWYLVRGLEGQLCCSEQAQGPPVEMMRTLSRLTLSLQKGYTQRAEAVGTGKAERCVESKAIMKGPEASLWCRGYRSVIMCTHISSSVWCHLVTLCAASAGCKHALQP